MNFTIIDAPQRSAAWFQARLGCVTASRAGDLVAALKSGEAAARRDYRAQLVCERVTNQPYENGYVNADMQRGIDLEADAFAAFEAQTGQLVTRVGFLRHVEWMAGASPDGVVGDFAGLIELKCPKSATHLKYLRAGGVPTEYLPQLTHQLWISEAAYVDFVSFDPRWPPPLQVFIARFLRDEAAIAAYAQKAVTFLAEVETEVAALRTLADLPGQLHAAGAV